MVIVAIMTAGNIMAGVVSIVGGVAAKAEAIIADTIKSSVISGHLSALTRLW
jgi:hypothetical protein